MLSPALMMTHESYALCAANARRSSPFFFLVRSSAGRSGFLVEAFL